MQAASQLIRPEAEIGTVTVWNDLPGHAFEGAIMVELGDLWAGEQRKLVLTFAVPAEVSSASRASPSSSCATSSCPPSPSRP